MALFILFAPESDFTLIHKIGIFVLGILSWTLMEYVMHRYLFHGEEYWMDKLPHSKWIWSFHFLMHGIHHAFPQDINRIVFPPIPGFFVLMLFAYLPSSFFISKEAHPIWYAGLILGYVCYDTTHFFMHHSSPKEGSYV